MLVLPVPRGRRRCRSVVVGLGVLIGMWLERILIVVPSLATAAARLHRRQLHAELGRALDPGRLGRAVPLPLPGLHAGGADPLGVGDRRGRASRGGERGRVRPGLASRSRPRRRRGRDRWSMSVSDATGAGAALRVVLPDEDVAAGRDRAPRASVAAGARRRGALERSAVRGSGRAGADASDRARRPGASPVESPAASRVGCSRSSPPRPTRS